MLDHLLETSEGESVAITAVAAAALDGWLAAASPRTGAWVRATGFAAEPGSHCLLPGDDGSLAGVAVGVKDGPDIWSFAGLPEALPEGAYRLEGAPERADDAVLGWALGCYRFTRYRAANGHRARLVWPAACERRRLAAVIAAVGLIRDLVNTPAEDMGPEVLAAAAAEVGGAHGARVSTIVGDDLLAAGYPAIHAVGRASARAPRLIDLTWGEPDRPRLTLVGKGVCFDAGGLDLKSAANMKLMKKDMGGAAHALGLAGAVMALAVPVRLRVLIPAVENVVAGNAYKPLDVVRTRKGLTVEIGNTDAEGRVVLADALAEAAAEDPALIVDFATLTGAARVALGPELPAFFTPDDDLAAAFSRHAEAARDPLWRLPLWGPYAELIESTVADIANAGDSPFAGAVTAALFLQRFVEPFGRWAHLDIMAWNAKARPGRPVGGEAVGLRAALALIEARFAG